MHVEQKRLFIGNLPSYIKEKDIENQFSKYGNVLSIDIKQRKTPGNENATFYFAFVSIKIDNQKLRQCLQEIPREEKWQGHQVKLELAKESFLDRLKKEREEAQNKLNKNDQNVQTPKADLSYIPAALSNKKKVYHSSESDNSEDENDLNNVKDKNHDEPDSAPLVIKNNRFIFDKKIKIESVSAPIHIITNNKTRKNELTDKKSIEADEKRRKSLQKMMNSYQNQKNTIKLALSSIDAKPANKIIFENDDIFQSENKRKHKNFNNEDKNRSKKGKMELFDNEEDDNSINFEIKNQFEGKSGQKLLELQSRFQNDRRFTLDSRFREDESDTEKETTEVPQKYEKQEQLDILESVLGQKIITKPKIENNVCMPDIIVRYDPSKPEHSKFEIKESKNDTRTSEKLKKNKNEVKEVKEKDVQVSQEKFYKVTDDLKKSFQENQGFSLLGLFGTANESDEKTPNDEKEKKLKKINNFDEKNPFKYDSSDTEDETGDTSKRKSEENFVNSQNVQKTSWAESFFFKENDERLQEGLRFLKKIFEPKADLFEDTRHKLKRVLQAKVRNRLRNNRPFLKKLGRSKRIKLKQAMRK